MPAGVEDWGKARSWREDWGEVDLCDPWRWGWDGRTLQQVVSFRAGMRLGDWISRSRERCDHLELATYFLETASPYALTMVWSAQPYFSGY